MYQETILFDINETVLNLSSLQPNFTSAFDDDKALSLWFSQLLHASTVCVATKVKTDFSSLASTMLDVVAGRLGVSLTAGVKTNLLSDFGCLPPHEDIKPALTNLKQIGFQLVAFSNSSNDLIVTQIKNAGLSDFFDDIVSVESTGSFKPDLKVYQFVAEKLRQRVENLRLVASHDWDIHGALTAGLNGAYLDRSGAPYNALFLMPDIYEKNMMDIAEAIIQKR
ncbi:MAG: haloacid dehalogenase type II [Paraglaciecola sp.]|uniref:haloacid dehalogenase type II n=2 Tax=Paraglaciecola sp. TaxID=1920173 RepID=UPI00326583C8